MYLAIKETGFTPSVVINPSEHRIVISGPSRLEDPATFYEELALVFEKKVLEFKSHITLEFRLSYLNSSSSKWLFHILKGLHNTYSGKKLITINWYYEGDDESILEAGEVFQSLLHLPFNIIEIDE